jgi:hypothetical protein
MFIMLTRINIMLSEMKLWLQTFMVAQVLHKHVDLIKGSPKGSEFFGS